MKKIFLLISCSFFIIINGKSQILSNPSFEGPNDASTTPPSWFNCNESSTPDTQPGFWNVYKSASQGNTYISLVTRGASGESNDNRIEAIGAELMNIQNNTCYSFSIDLAYSNSFTSYGIIFRPTSLNIWVGDNKCDKSELIFTSPEIGHTDWKTYNFNLSASYRYIIIEPNYVGTNKYYGNILIDNIQILENKLNIGNDTLLCQGELKSLTVDSFWENVLWSNGSRNNNNEASEGLTWVEVQKNGCTLRDSINIEYRETIDINFGRDLSLCEVDEIVLDASVSNGSYHWNTGSVNPLLITSNPGFYQVEITNGCETIIEEIFLLEKENCCNITAPNVFTPNSDGVNDYFEIKTTSNIESYELQIFNRWGSIVFTSNSLINSWNGKQLNNLSISSSEYYWNISIVCKEGKNTYYNSYKGTVMVLR